MTRLDGQSESVVITGASRGLGAAFARALAAPGVTLHLIARDAAALAAVAEACRARGAIVHLAALDVTEAAAMTAQLLAWDAATPVTLAIANAGTSAGTRPDGRPEGHALALRQVRVNLEGAMNLVEPLLPRLLARRCGHLVLVSSVLAFRGLPDAPGYAASKAGLWAYGEALRAGLAPQGIGVTLAAPGFFDSAMSARVQGGARFGQGSAEAMAGRILRAARAGRGRVVAPGWLAGRCACSPCCRPGWATGWRGWRAIGWCRGSRGEGLCPSHTPPGHSVPWTGVGLPLTAGQAFGDVSAAADQEVEALRRLDHRPHQGEIAQADALPEPLADDRQQRIGQIRIGEHPGRPVQGRVHP
jgi:short-subunit dehydrogenase